MTGEIHKLSLGICNCYLIKQEGLILVDSGTPGQGEKFLKELQKLSIEPGDVSLILLTHGHSDHIGSANELKRLTGAAVAINQREKDCVEQALKPLPPAANLWGKICGSMMKLSRPFIKFPGTPVDLVLSDEEYLLESYGIQGRILHTPGHTSGSMSLLLDTGEAFVGDLAMNGLPMRIGPGMPIFGDDAGVVRNSWRLLLSRGATWIYPGHGKPFEASVLEDQL